MFCLPPLYFGVRGYLVSKLVHFVCFGFFIFLFLFVVFWFTFLLLGTIAITSVPLFMFLSINGATLMIDIHRFPLLNVFMQGVRFEYIYFPSFINQPWCHSRFIMYNICNQNL